MAVFAFYRFQVEYISRKAELKFPDLTEKESYITPDNIFEKLFYNGQHFDLKKPIYKKNGSYDESRECDTYNADVTANHSGIIVMTIEDNKEKITIVEKEKCSHEHHPFCKVIIDYEHNFLAIEKNSAFDHKPEKVQDLMGRAFNQIFNPYRIFFSLTVLSYHTTDFWEAINQIRDCHRDKVKKISLDFNTCNSNADTSLSNIVTILTDISNRASAKGMWSLESEGDREIDINAIHEDLINIAEICYSQQQYDLIVNFQSYGIYRYGADVVAQYGIADVVIDNFVNEVDEMDLFDIHDTLDRWMDKMRMLFTDYETVTPITRPTKQSHRR